MSKWAGKFVIGLTGNIGTGKSVVRKMLEHLGAYGIDADALSHRAMAKGAPGFQQVVDLFGRYVIGPDGQIDRARLGKIVFADPEALVMLEKAIHPLVEQAVDIMIRRATQPVIVIEAIKLIESNLNKSCDSLWVSYTPNDIQLMRLVKNRKMNEIEARQRITAQPPQEQKVALANIVIKNVSTFEDTWQQVVAAWQRSVPAGKAGAPAAAVAAEATIVTSRAPQTQPVMRLPEGPMTVVRGRPRNSAEIAELINRVNRSAKLINKDDIMAAFGEKAFLMLQIGPYTVGVIGWQVENLVSRTTDIVLDPLLPMDKALPLLVKEMEQASFELQSEASLVFVPKQLEQNEAIWRSLGYEPRQPNALGILAWQEAVQESMPEGTVLYFKQLRQDRILRPI